MSFRSVLFGKVDLDTLVTALIMGVNPIEQTFRCLRGSASAQDLNDPEALCVEVGGSGQVANNNFDHHRREGEGESMSNLSACAQALERLARIVRYVDEIDTGKRLAHEGNFPSLCQLIAGMLLSVKDPEEQMEKGLAILREVLHSGIDPYASMEPILDAIDGGREYAEVKRRHDQEFEKVAAEAKWFTAKSGHKVAVVETAWFGAPGALYGKGAEIVVCLNPAFERGGAIYRKLTLAGHGLSIVPALEKLIELESGWGGPAHGTICGSPEGRDSTLSLETVLEIVLETL